ncbi:MAG: DNA polymerase III subunit delta [Halanaerobiaceae bacterium]
MDKILKKPLAKQKNVYLIFGEEDYLLDRFVERYIDKFVAEEVKDFNLTFLEDEQDFPANLKSKVSTVPVMSETRFVIARCENYFANKNTDDQILISLLENFPSTTKLIIVVYGKIDRRLKVNKAVKKQGKIVNLKPPRYQNLDQWIKKRFQKEGKTVDNKSISFLEHMFNNRLQRLDTEIEKIVTCFHNKDSLVYNDLRQIISKDRLLKDDVIFSFLDAFSSKDYGKALQILNEMLNEGEYPLKILAMINRQLRMLISVKELKKKGKAPQKTASILGEHPYPVKKCYRFCNNFSFEELEELLERSLETNKALVTGKYNDHRLALELMLLEHRTK